MLETSHEADGFDLFKVLEHTGWSGWDNALLRRVQVINTAALQFDVRSRVSVFVQQGRMKCGEMSMTS